MYRIAATDENGVATREVDWAEGYAASILPGHLYFQLLFRDTAAGQSGFNLLDSFHARLLP